MTKPDKTWIGWGFELPSVSLSLLMSPPLRQSLLSQNNCSSHLERTKAIVHLHAFTWHGITWRPFKRLRCQTLPPLWATSGTVLLPSSLSRLFFACFYFLVFLPVKRRACRTWLRQLDLIWVRPAQLELLVISDNRGAVPAWPGSDSIAALESALVDLSSL